MSEMRTKHVMWDDALPEFEFEWNGSLTVNVFYDGREIDVFTLSEPSAAHAERCAAEWLAEHVVIDED